jgi:branched-chain amino acid transport system ATP-binding protein
LSPMLEIKNITKKFGGLTALSDVSFDVPSGSIVGVMGANGAGKTTLFSLIAGNIAPTEGEIFFDKKSLVGLTPDRICRLGVARTFQIVKPFGGMTVRENLLTSAMFGAHQYQSKTLAAGAVDEVLEDVGLAAVSEQISSTLTLSYQKRLEIGRAVATGCRLILLDEVMAGLTPTEVLEMLETIRILREQRELTLLVIEHVMRALMQLCQQIVVLHHGELIAQGSPDEIGNNRLVHQVYLGETP